MLLCAWTVWLEPTADRGTGDEQNNISGGIGAGNSYGWIDDKIYEYTSLPWAEGLDTSSAKLSNFICICEHFPQTKYDIWLPKHRQMEI